MKNLLLIFAALYIFSWPATAQKAETSFYGGYFKKHYYVRATQPNARGRYKLEIEMQSLDERSDEIYFRFESRKNPDWISTMEEMKSTYLKWRQTAIENNVSNVTKLIKRCGFASFLCNPIFKIVNWHDAAYCPISFVFEVNDNSINLVITTEVITDHSNHYISSKGGAIVLSSEQEIDDFIACFDDGWVREFYESRKNTDELFN